MTACCNCVGNKDIERFIPVLVSCVARPDEVPETVHALSATTFVQAVEPPTLALVVPVLARGLRERLTAVKRKAAIITENMCKLVADPKHAAPLVPLLLPGLEKLAAEVSDPECRQVAERAHATILKAAGVKDSSGAAATSQAAAAAASKATPEAIEKVLREIITTQTPKTPQEAGVFANLDQYAPVLQHVSGIASSLIVLREFEENDWEETACLPYLNSFLSFETSAVVTRAFRERCFEQMSDLKEFENEADNDPAPDVCNTEFSLAYGAKILLNTARLRLKKGRRYGLVGANGCGKSTLMRAIVNGQVEGFPSPDEVRTVYVEHDIQGDQTEMNVTEFVLDTVKGVTEKEVRDTLTSLNFTEEMCRSNITTLSGGWKMKLALSRAMLMKAQIMLLDEPTNHLDTRNVAWLIDYLVNKVPDVTMLLVSHDSKFLDLVCTNVIHYHSFKLRTYLGNLSHFVKIYPEARSYYELAATPYRFSFPQPGFLQGVKTKDKAILKMKDVNFQYPGSARKQLSDISLFISLASRVVILGPNGAGKSTLVKLLTGELVPNTGMVWRHPDLRVAYVAQHAFHHVEQHLDKTPSEYIQWRYATGEDREAADKAANQLTAEEEKKMTQAVMLNGVKLVIEQVLNRRKARQSYEYEVQWVGQGPDKNQWMSRMWLTEQGWGKACDAIDSRIAAEQGMHSRPLTAANIAKHLEALGLEQEFTLHSRIRGLSGGQKVKVVLAACTWQNPHIIVMDEPTNFLDRDSLGALSVAIKEFEGGVVLISHHREFTDHLCGETWHVDDGRLRAEGESWAVPAAVAVTELADEVMDAAGNVIKVKKPDAELSGREKRKLAKEKAKKKKAGFDSEEED
jgi:elongation factor 3